MRKIFKNMAWMLTATLAMAACSDSLDESSGNGNSNEFTGDKGYVNIGINLPTTPSTRAESFNDGKAEEYKVDKVIIALFYGGTEEEAECKCAFQLTDKDFLPSGNATDNITSYCATGVRMISAPEDGEKVYALAIVNPISKFNVGTITSTNPDKENVGDATLTTYLTVDEGSGADKFYGTLSDLNKVIAPTAITDVTGNSYNYFLMTNAPISTKASFTGSKPGDLEIQTLAPIKVYNDKALAEGASKDNPIYVERAVAKTQVAVDGNDAMLTVTTDVTSYKGATVTFEGWKLQNTNKKYYPVRKVKADSETGLADINTWLGYFNDNESNRFIGTIANPYRTYWGIDPNYDKNENDEDLSKDYTILKSVNEKDWNKIGYLNNESAIEYCLENTTTAQTMAENRLTSVLLKATFTPAGAEKSTSFFMINNTSAIYTAEEFLKVATVALKDGDALTGSEKLAVKTMPTGSNITDAAEVKSLLQINGGSDPNLSDTQAAAILAAAGGNIKYYLQGITYYYATVIKHFGDTETPLASDAVINNATDYDEGKHLGRYGVLRNNWYELTITSVKGPGEPVIPEIPTTPPDKQESYINCEINVLSWAKRSQDVEL